MPARIPARGRGNAAAHGPLHAAPQKGRLPEMCPPPARAISHREKREAEHMFRNHHSTSICILQGGCKNFFRQGIQRGIRRGIRRGKSGRPDRLRLHPPPVSPGLPAGPLAMPLTGSFARPPSVPLARPPIEPLVGSFVGPLIAYRVASPGRSPGSPPDRSGGPPELGGMESKEI